MSTTSGRSLVASDSRASGIRAPLTDKGADSMTRGNRSLLIVSLAGVGAVVAGALQYQVGQRGTPEPIGAREATVDEPAGVVWPVSLNAGTDDAACAISADELKAWRASGDLLVADLRPSSEFEGIRIPGRSTSP